MLGVTGSVATIKMNELASLISGFANVKIVATKAARHFFSDGDQWGSQAEGVSTIINTAEAAFERRQPIQKGPRFSEAG